jgi:hypothetical protein
MRNAYIILTEKPKTNDHGDTGIDGRIILKSILKQHSVRV